MSIKVNREDFFGKLQSVQPGLTSKEVIEQSSCFVFVPGMIMTFNDEVSCRVPYDHFGKDFKGAVKAKPLLDLLAKLPEDELELEMDGAELLVTGAKRESGIRMEKEIMSAASSVEIPGEKDWKTMPDTFSEGLEIVIACAGDDESRFNMTCVHLTPKYIEACDNLQMARYRMKLGVEECIVKAKSLKQVNTLGMTEIAQTAKWLHFRNGNGLVLSCRLYKEDKGGELYPNLTEVLNVSGVDATLPGGLGEEVERAQIFSGDEKVLIELRAGKIRVKGQGASGWFRSTRKIEYDGPAMEFLMSPKLLIGLTKKYSACQIAPERLMVEGDRYTYISCLTKPQEPAANAKDEPETAEAYNEEVPY